MAEVNFRGLPRWCLVLLLGSAAGWAQVTADRIPQVIVLGSRFSDPIDEDAPIGAQIISAEQIRRVGATNVTEAIKKLGGVHARVNFFGTPDEPLDLRGFGITGDQNTLILLDGIRLSENELVSARLAGIPIESVERIEIQRGSGTVLYGGGATAGAINIVTKAIRTGERHGDLVVGGGSWNTTDLRAGASIAGENVGLTFNTNRFDSQNYRQNNGVRQSNVSGSMRAFNDLGEIGLRFGTERQFARLPGFLFESEMRADRRQTFSPRDYSDTDANNYVAFARTRFGPVELALDAYQRDRVTRSYVPGRPFGGVFFDFFIRTGVRQSGYSPRLKSEFKLADIVNSIVVGHDAARWHYRSVSNFVANDAVLESAQFDAFNGTDERGSQKNAAWYFKNESRIGDSLRLSVGARRESVRMNAEQPFSSFFGQNYRYSLDKYANAHELGASYTFSSRWNAYLHGGHSYRLANVDENRGRTTPLDVQTSRDLTFGIRYRDGSWAIEAKGFRHILENEIGFVSAAIIPPFGQNINLAPTVRSGVELDGHWRPLKGLKISGAYQYVDARFRAGTMNGIEVAGNQVPLVPRHRASLRAAWLLDASQTLSAGFRYVGEQVLDNDWTNQVASGRRLPGYGLADLRFAFTKARIEWAASVDNLFDKRNVSYGGVLVRTGSLFLYPDPTRTWRLSAALRF